MIINIRNVKWLRFVVHLKGECIYYYLSMFLVHALKSAYSCFGFLNWVLLLLLPLLMLLLLLHTAIFERWHIIHTTGNGNVYTYNVWQEPPHSWHAQDGSQKPTPTAAKATQPSGAAANAHTHRHTGIRMHSYIVYMILATMLQNTLEQMLCTIA